MIKLSGFKIIKKIGSGGMGDVYLAEHDKLEKKVAIKSLHKNLAADLGFKERFFNEAKIQSKLDHPNIVKLLDYKERKDGLFLIMEYVDGKQLDDHIKKISGPIPEKELIALFTQLLDAIGYSHTKGLVHRDIKPSNIMIDKEGRIKVLDFGIAKMQDEDKGLTKTGVQIGTASYMSPEQVNAQKLDKLTDIYSLGVTLFYMSVGKSPYDEETNTFLIQSKIISDPLPLARDIYPGVSKRFEEIINKATQKKKKDRYQSCEDFKNGLNTIKKDEIRVEKGNKKRWKNTILFSFSLIILVSGSIILIPVIKEEYFLKTNYKYTPKINFEITPKTIAETPKTIAELVIINEPGKLIFNVLEVLEVKQGKAFDSHENFLGRIKDGKRDGEWKEYYHNDQVAIEGNYSNGLMNGYFKHYWKTGELYHEGVYKKGDKTEINENSGIPQTGRDGTHIFYYKNGQIASEANYNNYKLMKAIEYHFNGLIQTEWGIKNGKEFHKKWDISGQPISAD